MDAENTYVTLYSAVLSTVSCLIHSMRTTTLQMCYFIIRVMKQLAENQGQSRLGQRSSEGETDEPTTME